MTTSFSIKLMNLMNLYDKESELSDYERIEMYSQIIEELKSDKIFDIILFDIIALGIILISNCLF